MTATWNTDLLQRLATAPEVRLSVLRTDGTARRPVPVGLVRVGDGIFIRSYLGPAGRWYRASLATGRAELEVGGMRLPVALVPDGRHDDEIDRAFPAKYGTDAAVRQMIASPARETTLRVEPES